jgi:flagellar biosynthesis protein
MKHPARPRAAALEYKRGQACAPTLVAKGNDEVAEEILAVAREHGVPIHHDPALVNVLSRLDLDDEIPTQLFVAVATMLAFIYRLQAEQE